MNLSMEIKRNYNAGLPILEKMIAMSKEDLIKKLKANLNGNSLVSEILNKGVINYFDGEIAIHLEVGQNPFILVDACHVYLITKDKQEQIKLTAEIGA